MSTAADAGIDGRAPAGGPASVSPATRRWPAPRWPATPSSAHRRESTRSRSRRRRAGPPRTPRRRRARRTSRPPTASPACGDGRRSRSAAGIQPGPRPQRGPRPGPAASPRLSAADGATAGSASTPPRSGPWWPTRGPPRDEPTAAATAGLPLARPPPSPATRGSCTPTRSPRFVNGNTPIRTSASTASRSSSGVPGGATAAGSVSAAGNAVAVRMTTRAAAAKQNQANSRPPDSRPDAQNATAATKPSRTRSFSRDWTTCAAVASTGSAAPPRLSSPETRVATLTPCRLRLCVPSGSPSAGRNVAPSTGRYRATSSTAAASRATTTQRHRPSAGSRTRGAGRGQQ